MNISWAITKVKPSTNRGFETVLVDWTVEWEDVRLRQNRYGIPVTDESGNYVIDAAGTKKAHVLTTPIDVWEDAPDDAVVSAIEAYRQDAEREARVGMETASAPDRHKRLLNLKGAS